MVDTDPDGGSNYSLSHVAHQTDSMIIGFSFVGATKDGCMFDEVVLTISLYSNNVQFEPAARLTNSVTKINLFEEMSILQEGIVLQNYSVHITPTELDQLGQESPVISDYELTGFNDAVREYFRRTSDLVSCNPVDF